MGRTPRTAFMMALALIAGCRLIPAGDWEAVEALDQDGDGWLPDDTADCDDQDPGVFPGADEVCGDGAVNGCGELQDALEWCRYPGWLTLDEQTPALVGPEGALAGAALASPGDLDGDGAADLAVVAAGEAAVYLAPGPFEEQATLGSAGTTLTTIGRVDHVILSAPGDLDGDDQADLVVGLSMQDLSGTVYLVDGPLQAGSAALSSFVAYARAGSSDGFAELSVSAGGDLSGDEVADLLVGAPGRRADQGIVYGLFGPLSGASDLSAVADFTLAGDDGFRMGSAIAEQGDLDGDGVADLVVGAPGATDEYYSYLGVAFVEPGPLSGTLSYEDVTLTLYGSYESSGVGSRVVIGRDMDGDGRDDLVVQALGFGGYSGYSLFSCYNLYLGEQIFDAVQSCAGIIVDDYGNDRVMGYDLDAGTDLNADGYSDLLIGRPSAGLLEPDDYDGYAHVVYSPMSGWGTIDQVSAAVLTGTGNPGVAARFVPDGNDDGLPEILVGAPLAEPDGASESGAVFLVHGGFY